MDITLNKEDLVKILGLYLECEIKVKDVVIKDKPFAITVTNLKGKVTDLTKPGEKPAALASKQATIVPNENQDDAPMSYSELMTHSDFLARQPSPMPGITRSLGPSESGEAPGPTTREGRKDGR